MKVGFASADWSLSVVEEDGTPCMGGSGWIRIGQYSRFLDIDHVIGTLVYSKSGEIFGVTDTQGNHHLDCDVIYMQRWMEWDIPDNVHRAKANGQIIVNDLDDWYWGLHDKHFAKSRIDPKNNPETNTSFYRDILSRSDLVVVSTPFLADKAKSRLGVRNIAMLENCVDFDAYELRKHAKGITTIGWHGSTAHRSGDLEILQSACPYLNPKAFAFHHTGYTSMLTFSSGETAPCPSFWDEIGVKQDQVSLYPMVSPTKIGRMLTFDVGVAPLTDNPFNHAKSWIKPLEYIAAGIPFVASKTPEYKRLQKKFGIGRFAGKGADWIKHFNSLSNSDLRQSEAQSNLEAVQSLDVRQGALRLTQILESIK